MLPPLQADTRRTATLPQLLRQARSIARIDVGFFFRRAKFVWSIAAIALIAGTVSFNVAAQSAPSAQDIAELKKLIQELDHD